MSLSEAQGLKVAKELVRTVGRAFFADDAVVVLDALVDDAYLRDDELSERFLLPSKQMRSVLQRLQHEKLVSCETLAIELRAEPKDEAAAEAEAEGAKKKAKLAAAAAAGPQSVSEVFWYVDYQTFVNVVRWRVHMIIRDCAATPSTTKASNIGKLFQSSP